MRLDTAARPAPSQRQAAAANRHDSTPQQATSTAQRLQQSPRQQAQAAQLRRLQPSAGAPAQAKKDETERAYKHRRGARAQQTIALLGNNVRASLQNHIFNAQPVAGGALVPANPTGLHAYTNGALPAAVAAVGRQGSAGRIHTLTWHAAAGGPNKDSTMFPSWMPRPHVNTLIALKYATVRANGVNAGDLDADAAKTYIQHGQNVYDRITKVGDTVYPQ